MKKVWLLVWVVLCHQYTTAQAPNSMAFPSANNSFLNRVGSPGTGVGVNLYTGTAQISIPICNLAAREISIPLSLHYTGARGIKIQEYATSVGLGWQLQSGGGISRVVRGFPDEYPNGYLGTGLWGQKVVSWKTNNTALPNQITGWNGSNYGNPSADGEPDIFFIKTPFFSFQFVFDEYGVPVFPNNTGLKFVSKNFYYSSSYSLASFQVMDDAGNQYFFGSSSAAVEKTTTTLYGTSYTIPTTWYLDRIITFNGKETINFNYISSATNEVSTRYQTTKNYLYNGCTSTNSTPVTSTVVQPKYISSITSPVGRVDFTYAFDRRDVVNAGRLTGISLKSVIGTTTTELQKYAFQYGYFNEYSTDINLLRLRLDRITVAGNSVSTATPVTYKSFTYHTGSSLPARNAQNFDYWGYQNSLLNGTTTGDPMANPTLRKPNEAMAKAGILTSVKDMAGSTLHLEYELHAYYRAADNTNTVVGGLRVKRLLQKLPTGESRISVYTYVDAGGRSTGEIMTESYRNLVFTWYNAGVDQVLSEAPSIMYDLNGNFIGYTQVKVQQQNGGYTLSTFTNFSTYPDEVSYLNSLDPNTAPNITSSTSSAFKRGLLRKQVVYAASGSKISEDEYIYQSLTAPATRKSWAFHWYKAAYSVCGSSGYNMVSSSYSHNVENFRVVETVHKDYDQKDPNSFVQKTTYFAYADNKRLVRSISTSSSKEPTNINRTQTFYYAEDYSIPMVNTSEQNAIYALRQANANGLLIHQTSSIAGAVSQVHNSYETSSADGSKVFLASTSAYKGSVLLQQQFFNYDDETASLLSSNTANSKPTSLQYGYNGSYAVAKVTNAKTYNTYAQTTGNGYSYITGSASIPFTVGYYGTIAFNLNFTSYPGSGTSVTINYTLSGPSSRSGYLCLASYGVSCYYPSSVSFTSMPPGNYTLSYYVVSNNVITTPSLTYSYPRIQVTAVSEHFYEGFEQAAGAQTGNAHTGKAYKDASASSYYVNFTPPNSRSYVIQWWRLLNGKWEMQEEPYTGPRYISGVIDDIRVFPADAQMTTFTYDPLVGKTSETDASGRTSTYEYDGLGRIHIVRDNDRNIVSVTCYNVQGQEVNCKLYSSQDLSGYYYSQNCSPGEEPDPYYVNVPAGMYTSYSQASADAMAAQYAQDQANTYGTCHTSEVRLYVENYTGYTYYIELYNTATGQYYWFQSYNTGVVGYIPAGTYDIYLSSSGDYGYRSYYAGCSYYTSGNGYANFYGVYLSSSCNYISIY